MHSSGSVSLPQARVRVLKRHISFLYSVYCRDCGAGWHQISAVQVSSLISVIATLVNRSRGHTWLSATTLSIRIDPQPSCHNKWQPASNHKLVSVWFIVFFVQLRMSELVKIMIYILLILLFFFFSYILFIIKKIINLFCLFSFYGHMRIFVAAEHYSGPLTGGAVILRKRSVV